jgi:hypothetical protein
MDIGTHEASTKESQGAAASSGVVVGQAAVAPEAPRVIGDVEGYVTLTEREKTIMRRRQREVLSHSADGIQFITGFTCFTYRPSATCDEDTMMLRRGHTGMEGEGAPRDAAEAIGIVCVLTKSKQLACLRMDKR